MRTFSSQSTFVRYSNCFHSFFILNFAIPIETLKHAAKILFFTLIFSGVNAQEGRINNLIQDVRRQHLNFGGRLLTSGINLEANYTYSLREKTRIGIQVQCGNLKSKREHKVDNTLYQDSKPYVFGKLNNLYTLHLGLQYQRILFEIRRKNGVQISFLASGGGVLGKLTPNYVYLRDPYLTDNSIKPTLEKYDPENQFPQYVYGRASYFEGWDESSRLCGYYGDMSFFFDIARREKFTFGLKLGGRIDHFSDSFVLFYRGADYQTFTSLYTSIIIGLNK